MSEAMPNQLVLSNEDRALIEKLRRLISDKSQLEDGEDEDEDSDDQEDDEKKVKEGEHEDIDSLESDIEKLLKELGEPGTLLRDIGDALLSLNVNEANADDRDGTKTEFGSDEINNNVLNARALLTRNAIARVPWDFPTEHQG